jgi:hypothetical protein
MSWRQFFASVINSLAWPGGIIIILLLLREPVIALLPKLRLFKYKDWQLEFGEKLEKAEADASNLPPSPELDILPQMDEGNEQRFRLAADISPNYAVLEAWLPVEKALQDLAAAKNIPPRRGTSSLYLTRMLGSVPNKGIPNPGIL